MCRAVAIPTRCSYPAVVNNFIEALNQEPRLARTPLFSVPRCRNSLSKWMKQKPFRSRRRIADMYATLQSTMGSFYINDFNLSGRTYRVQLQAEPEYRMTQEDLGRLYVRSQTGAMVPLSALSNISTVAEPSNWSVTMACFPQKCWGAAPLA